MCYALLGKSGLYAFDFEGNELWHVDVGQLSDPARWGDGTSPIVVDDLIIVDAGVLGHRFVGFDKKTGKEIWSLQNADFTNGWATPTIVEVNGKEEVLFNVPKRLYALDPTSGRQLWSAESPLDDAACGSVVTSGDVAFIMGSRAGHALAVRCGGIGDVTATNTVWNKRLQAGICTPLIVGENIYWCTNGIFFAASTSTGEYLYKERLPRLGGATGGFPNADYSSPIALDDRIVQFTRNGESYVIEAGDKFTLIAHNPAFDGDSTSFSATPAASDKELFVRSEGYLYCVGE
ncbi:MAG: PQQ-binding-like beta-propeller repeat protein [Pirellulales bacterium]